LSFEYPGSFVLRVPTVITGRSASPTTQPFAATRAGIPAPSTSRS
jgi:hypothetical protein